MSRLRKLSAFVVMELLTDLSYRTAFVGRLFFTLFSIASFYFLGQMLRDVSIPSLAPYGRDYFSFALVGLAFSATLDVAVRAFAETIRAAQVQGTLEAVLCTPTRVIDLLLGSALYDLMATIVRTAMVLLIGWFFGAGLDEANWPAAFVCLAVCLLAFAPLGLFAGTVVLVFKRADPSSWLTQGLSYLLGGVFYPIAVLPGWLQDLAQFLPLTHALEAFRKLLLRGASLQDVWRPLLCLCLFAALALPIAFWLFRLALRRVRREGSLCQF